jgi:transposase
MLNTLPSPIRPTRRRGGQPANQNARKLGTFSTCNPGPLSATRQLVNDLNFRYRQPGNSPYEIHQQAFNARQELFFPREFSTKAALSSVELSLKLSKIISRLFSQYVPFKRLSNALEEIAFDPFGWFERGYQDSGISRDADSFFSFSKNSALNSPLPPWHPSLATNLTDAQWAVLAPLIPPDPCLDFPPGEPPILIAANRWKLTRYHSTGAFDAFVVMADYRKILQRLPALCPELPSQNPQDLGRGRRRGRPAASPRALLDAIIWKLATGHTWFDLPCGFPPMRLCRNYYRRLFKSGRWYTLLLALYNHMRLETGTDPAFLLETGIFTTTARGQKIALSPHALPTSENYTALLFMQLARAAYSRLQRNHKQAHPISFPLLSFKGAASLSTGEIHSLGSQQPAPAFQPLEASPVWNKWCKLERDRATLQRQVSVRLPAPATSPLLGPAPLPGRSPLSKCALSFGEGPGVRLGEESELGP